MTLRYTIRPISDRTQFTGPAAGGDRSPFAASWSSTLILLERELDYLGASNVVLEVDVTERDVRVDGTLRANARPTSGPGVRLAFDSDHGPLIYGTDRFGWDNGSPPRFYTDGWQQNVRAIALGLEALRRVDRYAISRRGEQYRGFKAIESGIAMAAAMTADDALRLLERINEVTLVGSLLDAGRIRLEVRVARRRTHPDANGGAREAWNELERAVAALEAAGMWSP